jgi:hypothetical protein
LKITNKIQQRQYKRHRQKAYAWYLFANKDEGKYNQFKWDFSSLINGFLINVCSYKNKLPQFFSPFIELPFSSRVG